MSEHELTCGIEIHQQLDTTKLFCSCRSELVESDEKTFLRRLRPTASEMGEITVLPFSSRRSACSSAIRRRQG